MSIWNAIGTGLTTGVGAVAKGIKGVTGKGTALGGLTKSVEGAMPIIGAGMFVADKIMKAVQFKKNKKIKGRLYSGITDKFQDQLSKITEQKEAEEDKIDYQYGAQDQQLNIQGQKSLEGLVKATQTAENQGFETSEETTLETDELLANYNDSIQNLVDTRKMNMESVLNNSAKARDAARDQRDQQMAQASKIQTKFGWSDLIS